MTIPADPPAAPPAQRRPAPSSFDAFFRAHYGPTVRLSYLLTGSNAVAEELAQDAFALIYTRFDAVLEPKSYLRTTTVNVCRNWHRRHRRELDRFRRHGPLPEGDTDRVEELIDAIATLPYRQRAVLVMRYWLDLSEAEIARALDCRPGTVKSLHSRAVAAIRKDIS